MPIPLNFPAGDHELADLGGQGCRAGLVAQSDQIGDR
jgi:hypothetical protein